MKIRIRPSVRALMALVLVMALGLGWVVNAARTQRLAVEAIRRAGGTVVYDWQDEHGFHFGEPRAPKWLVDLLGPDYFGHVRYVRLDRSAASDEEMRHVGRLARLEGLSLQDTSVTDTGLAPPPPPPIRGLIHLKQLHLRWNVGISGAGLVNIRGLVEIQSLTCDMARFNDADMEHLARLTALLNLDLSRSPITDAGLAHLRGLDKLSVLNLETTLVTDLAPIAGLDNLTSLSLGMTPITDAGLAPIASFPRLRDLSVHDTKITDAGLRHIGRSSSLEDLSLYKTHITDAGLRHLTGLKTLARMCALDTAVTDSGNAELQESLPKLDVNPIGRRCGPPPRPF